MYKALFFSCPEGAGTSVREIHSLMICSRFFWIKENIFWTSLEFTISGLKRDSWHQSMAGEKENTRNKLNKPDPIFLFMVIPPLDLFGLVPKLLDSGICISFSIRHSEELSDAMTLKGNVMARKSNQSRTFVTASKAKQSRKNKCLFSHEIATLHSQ